MTAGQAKISIICRGGCADGRTNIPTGPDQLFYIFMYVWSSLGQHNCDRHSIVGQPWICTVLYPLIQTIRETITFTHLSQHFLTNGELLYAFYYHSHVGLFCPILFGLSLDPATSHPTAVHMRMGIQQQQEDDDSPGSVGGDKARL